MTDQAMVYRNSRRFKELLAETGAPHCQADRDRPSAVNHGHLRWVARRAAGGGR